MTDGSAWTPLSEDPRPTDDLGEGAGPTPAEDPTAGEEFDTSLEALQDLLDAEAEAGDLAVEEVPIPPISWARDADHPDFAHALTSAAAGLPLQAEFVFDWSVFDLLIRANRFRPRGKNGLVAFGLRGGRLVGEDAQEGAASVRIADTRPDHENFHCTLGIVDTGARTISAYAGSTVPNKKWMQNYFKLKNGIHPHKSTRSNLLPTGCYIYRVNAHGGGRINPALRMTDPDNLTADAVCTVLRTHHDLTYSHDDLWDRCTPYDNIHCAYSATSFSSAGCQTIKGADGQGPWGAFQDAIGALGWNARLDYVLLTAREAAIAAAILAAGRGDDESLVQAALGRLRVGSEGETVTALQKKLGFNGSAYFGPSTKKRLVEAEAARGLNSDGIYAPADDLKTGWAVFGAGAVTPAADAADPAEPAEPDQAITLRLSGSPAGDHTASDEGAGDALVFHSEAGAEEMTVAADATLSVGGTDLPLRIAATIGGIPASVGLELRVAALPRSQMAASEGEASGTETPTLTAERFDRFAPRARAEYREAMLQRGHEVLGEHGIDSSPRRLAHFLAQIGHESGGFAFRIESLNYTTAARIQATWPNRFPTVADAEPFVRNEPDLAEKVYGGRMGNDRPGEGFLYRGRGLIQLTGRNNYQEYSDRLGIDLVGNPDLAFEPVVALRIAAEYWTQRKLRGERPMNALADDDKLRAITYRINGGFTNFEHREAELAKAKAIWGDSGSGAATGRIVDRGDFSDDVRHLQLSLVALGWLGGTVDGKFGYNTYKALFGFKTRVGLSGAGYADQATFEALADAELTEAVPVEEEGTLPMIGDEPEPVRNGISLGEDEAGTPVS